MLKFNAHLKNLSRQKMALYGVFRIIPEEEQSEHLASLTKDPFAGIVSTAHPANLEFFKTHSLISILTSKDQFEQFMTHYYIQKHWDHFELWCPAHGFESTDSPEAINTYLEDCVDPEEFGSDLTLVKWVYSADEVARSFRLLLNCIPLPIDDADDQFEFAYFTHNIAVAVKECLEAFTPEQWREVIVSNHLEDLLNPKTTPAEPQTAADTEAKTEAPKKRGRRPKQVKEEETTNV